MKNKRLNKSISMILAAFMTAGVLTGCGSDAEVVSTASSTTETKQESTKAAESTAAGDTAGTTELVSAKDTIVWGSDGAASGVFHPTLQYSNYDREVVFLVFDRLITTNADGEYVPSLAESYEVNDDATTFTFYLKQGIKWQDGEDFTAEDVAFTYETTCHADFGKGYDEFSAALLGADEYHAGTADHVEGIQVIDEYTVSFTFKEPYLDALVKFIDKPVLAKHIWETVPVGEWGDAAELLKNPVGTGPYKVVEFVQDQYVKLEANPDYFKGEPLIKYFIFKVSNTDTRQVEMVNGDIDIAEVSSWRAEDLQGYIDNGIVIEEQPDVNASYLVFDTTDSRLSDNKVRQAVFYALDQQGIVDALLAGHGSLSYALMKPSNPYYPADRLTAYDYDPEKAVALLKEAGWTDTDGDGIVDKNGEPLHLTFQYSTGADQLAQVLQQYEKAVGIDIELVSQDFNTVLAVLKDSTQEFDLALMGATYRPNSGYGGSNTWMARFDKDETEVALLNAATTSKNTEEAKENYASWALYTNEQAAMLPIYFENQGYVYNPKLQNYQATPNEWFPNVETWYFAE